MPSKMNVVHFQVEFDTYKLMQEGTQRWWATRWDLSDDRIYSLAFGMRGEGGKWISDVLDLIFSNGHEQLVFRVVAIHFPAWAVGWGVVEFRAPHDPISADVSEG